MSALYYEPRDYGLEVVAEVDFAGDYEFDKIIVWRHVLTGKLVFAEDSGCSCPTPFENVGVLDLKEVGLDLIEESIDRRREGYRWDGQKARVFLEQVKAAMP